METPPPDAPEVASSPTLGEHIESKLAVEEPTPAPDAPQEEAQHVPYERFKEVNDKFRSTEAELAALQGRYNDPELQAAANMVQLIKNDPTRALAELEPIISHLKQIRGDELPKDLHDAVEEGVLTKAYAKELAQLRLKSTATAAKLQQTEAEQHVSSVASALTSWDMAQRQKDSDFTPESPKWQFVLKQLNAELKMNPNATSADALAMAETIYADANKIFTAPKATAPRTVLRSNSASKASQPDPHKMSLMDYISANLATNSRK